MLYIHFLDLNISTVVVAEWLRRWTRNPLGSSRAGSNPADNAKFFSLLNYRNCLFFIKTFKTHITNLLKHPCESYLCQHVLFLPLGMIFLSCLVIVVYFTNLFLILACWQYFVLCNLMKCLCYSTKLSVGPRVPQRELNKHT